MKRGEVTVIKRIHINQHNIRHNAKNPDDLRPVVTVKTSTGNHKGFKASIHGAVDIIYSPDKPLACGAKVWMQTHDTVLIEQEDGSVLGVM